MCFFVVGCVGPMENTRNDFWQMIWAEEIPTIVMLTALVERGKVHVTVSFQSEIFVIGFV